MNALARLLRNFAADESGTTAIEYGIIVALIFLAILSSVQVVGGMTSVLYELVAAMM